MHEGFCAGGSLASNKEMSRLTEFCLSGVKGCKSVAPLELREGRAVRAAFKIRELKSKRFFLRLLE